MIYVEAPNTAPQKGLSLFLAGGITDCPPWQSELIKMIDKLDMIVFNPHRKNFPIHDPNAAFGQIKWEYERLREADIISFWFCAETMCPIVLFELGAHLMTNKPIIVGMDPGYSRRQDVEIQTKLVRPEIKIVYDLKSLSDQIAETFNQMAPFVKL